jgi:tetratricopeptide (TPR) repeat protein
VTLHSKDRLQPALPPVAELQQAVTLAGGDPYYEGSLGHVYAVSGETEKASAVLQDLQNRSRKQYVPAYAIALVYAGLGDNEHAFNWLEKAYEDRSNPMAYLDQDPELSSLHPDPRFVQLSRRVNFDQTSAPVAKLD